MGNALLAGEAWNTRIGRNQRQD